MTSRGEGAARLANGRAATILAHLAALILAVLAVVTFSDVFARYFLNQPFSFAVEITELAMGLIVYLGVGLTTHDNGHINVDVVTLRVSPWLRAVMETVTWLLALGFLLTLVWRLWLRAVELLDKGDYTQILQLPIWPVAFVMALASVLLLTGVLLNLTAAFGRAFGRGEG